MTGRCHGTPRVCRVVEVVIDETSPHVLLEDVNSAAPACDFASRPLDLGGSMDGSSVTADRSRRPNLTGLEAESDRSPVT
jgi:hypothetical protein